MQLTIKQKFKENNGGVNFVVVYVEIMPFTCNVHLFMSSSSSLLVLFFPSSLLVLFFPRVLKWNKYMYRGPSDKYIVSSQKL
jgi:hypothetical protein